MSSVEALMAEITRAHEEVKRGAPGAEQELQALQARFRASGSGVVRTPRGGTVNLVETAPRRGNAKRVPQPKPKRKQRPSWWLERPSWWLGEDEPEPWRLRY
jgi:hypothetical protein